MRWRDSFTLCCFFFSRMGATPSRNNYILVRDSSLNSKAALLWPRVSHPVLHLCLPPRTPLSGPLSFIGGESDRTRSESPSRPLPTHRRIDNPVFLTIPMDPAWLLRGCCVAAGICRQVRTALLPV